MIYAGNTTLLITFGMNNNKTGLKTLFSNRLADKMQLVYLLEA